MNDRRVSDGSPTSDDKRASRIESIVFDHLQRRLEGEPVADEHVIAQHPELMPELEDQLRWHRKIADQRAANQVLETVAREPMKCTPGAFETEDSVAPTMTGLGNYKLLQQIGEGGMGSVWMADQEKPVRRRVAIKLIKKGLDNKQVIARFEAERQALAMMDHQNISKVLDAGATEDGSPYFVMELVQGIPLTDYCDQNKLTPNERLSLFIPVCQAVQHAHQKGIVHRDLKPSNVLVTLYDGKPVAKVIDFGLAKALQPQTHLTDKTMFTQFGQVVGTLQYMSPEQAEMNALDVDTRTDIYSLGVMLYEILTGSTPLDAQTLKEATVLQVLQLIREKEPPRPSTRLSDSGDAIAGISRQRTIEPRKLQQILRGELDWIVMKSLEKDRTRRYETANGLARDLENYLLNEPVSARPPSAAYLISKFLRKHSTLAAATSAIILLLISGIAATSWLWLEAEEARRRAKNSETMALQEKNFATEQSKLALEQSQIAATLRQLAATQAYSLALKLAHQKQSEPVLPEHGTIGTGAEFDFLIARNRRSILLENEPISCWALSPDRKTMVTCHGSGLVKLHDLDQRELVEEFYPVGPTRQKMDFVDFSKDGRGLICAIRGKAVYTISLAQKKLIETYSMAKLDQLRILPQQNRFYFDELGKGKIVGFDWESGQPTGEWTYEHSDVQIDWFEVSPDGSAILASTEGPDETSLLASEKDKNVCLVSLPQFATVKSYVGTQLPATSPNLSTFSPNGKYFLLLDGDQLKMFSTKTGDNVQTFQNRLGTGFESASFSPDGHYIYSIEKLDTPASSIPFRRGEATGSTKSLTIRDATTADVVQRIVSPTITDYFISADGNRLLADGRIWEREDSRTLNSAPIAERPFYWQAIGSYGADQFAGHNVRFLQDGKSFVAAGHLWSEDLYAKNQLLQSKIVAVAPDGSQLIAPGQSKLPFTIWDSRTGQRLGAIRTFHPNVSYSGDSKFIVTWDRSEIKIWNAANAREVATVRFERENGSEAKRISNVQLSRNGQYIIAQLVRADMQSECRVWDLEAEREILTINNVRPATTNPIRVSGNKLIVVTRKSNVASAEVWDLDTQTKRFAVPRVDRRNSPRDLLLVAEQEQKLITLFRKDADADFQVGVFSLETGHNESSFNVEKLGTMQCYPSMNGQSLAVARDEMIHVHDATNGELLKTIDVTIDHAVERLDLAFSDDGTRLIGFGEQEILIWHIETGIELIRYNLAAEKVHYSKDIFLQLARWKFLQE